MEQELQNFLNKKRISETEEIIVIPVVVHVVYAPGNNQIGVLDNISDEQIFSAMEVLNLHFRRQHEDTINTPYWFQDEAADVGIEFKLATLDPEGNTTTGITRHESDRSFWNYNNNDERELKEYGYWPSDQYLNIWVARLSNSLLGYSYFPDGTGLAGFTDENNAELDGVVMNPTAFGNEVGLATGSNNPYRFGLTFVHEVGHWLGLWHTFGSGCTSYTDYCDDTPPQTESSLSLDLCDEVIIGECGDTIMHQNYMDFTPDECMNIFTNDQKSRMRAVMELSPRRNSLLNSIGACGTSQLALPYLMDFSDEEEVTQTWQLTTSNDENINWVLEFEKLWTESESIDLSDSLVLSSEQFKISNSTFLKFDFESSGLTDSIKIYYTYNCSSETVLLETILTNQESINHRVSLENIAQDGYVSLHLVLYNNGYQKQLDNIQLFEDTDDAVLSIHPNPNITDGILNISMNGDQEVNYSIFDLNGKVFQEKSLGVINSSEMELDFTGLTTGLYLIRFSVGDQTITRKVVIH